MNTWGTITQLLNSRLNKSNIFFLFGRAPAWSFERELTTTFARSSLAWYFCCCWSCFSINYRSTTTIYDLHDGAMFRSITILNINYWSWWNYANIANINMMMMMIRLLLFSSASSQRFFAFCRCCSFCISVAFLSQLHYWMLVCWSAFSTQLDSPARGRESSSKRSSLHQTTIAIATVIIYSNRFHSSSW
jgi:hypothetical protein